MSQAFYVFDAYSHLKELVSSFNECADSMIKRLKQFADGQTAVPFRDEMGKIAVEVIMKVTLLFSFTHALHTHGAATRDVNHCIYIYIYSNMYKVH